MFDYIRNIIGFNEEKAENRDISKLKVKSGFDSSGMPYIDLTDKNTAIIFKEKLKAFEEIKTIK